MFNVGGGELLVIALIALIVLGPERLPEAARTVGKVMGEIRRLSTGFQDEVRHAFDEGDAPTAAAATPASSPLAAEVAELDRGDIDAADRTPLRAIEASVTEAPAAADAPRDAPVAEVAPDVAAALGEALGDGEQRAAS